MALLVMNKLVLLIGAIPVITRARHVLSSDIWLLLEDEPFYSGSVISGRSRAESALVVAFPSAGCRLQLTWSGRCSVFVLHNVQRWQCVA